MSILFKKIYKPLFKIETILIKSSFILFIIEFVLGLIGEGWLILIISVFGSIISIMIGNIQLLNLRHIKYYYKSLTAKEATDIVQTHLKEPISSNMDTIYFLSHYKMDSQNKDLNSKL